jgi:hypothetical protein
MAPGFVIGLFRSGGIKDTGTGYLRLSEISEVGRYGRTKKTGRMALREGLFR